MDVSGAPQQEGGRLAPFTSSLPHGVAPAPSCCLLTLRAFSALTSHTSRSGASTCPLPPHHGPPTAQVPTRHFLCREPQVHRGLNLSTPK